jgi:hypothetical protein
MDMPPVLCRHTFKCGLGRMEGIGFPPGMNEMDSEYKRKQDLDALRGGNIEMRKRSGCG